MSTSTSTRNIAGLTAFVVGLPTAAVAIGLWDPASNGGPPLCPFRGLTGVACPGCGLTRAAGALLRGRVGEALDIHPLIVLLAVQLVAVWAIAWYLRRHSDRAPGQLASPRRALQKFVPRWVIPGILGANAALFVGVWLVRLASGSLDTSA